jgi:hypothetical protein
MLYVLLMSTDADIVAVQLGPNWPGPGTRCSYAQLEGGGLNIPNGATIVVIAHGNNTEIGNATPGTIDINETMFLYLIQNNMAAGAVPGNIYISACSKDIAQFAAAVAIAAAKNNIWPNTRIFGHGSAVVGPIASPGTLGWFQIFP